MERAIWKFALLRRLSEVHMPPAATVLTVQMQDGLPALWAVCDTTTRELETRRFRIYATGEPLPPAPGRYVSTVQDLNGLVWHVFESTAALEAAHVTIAKATDQ